MINITIFGSSDQNIALQYQALVESLVNQLFLVSNDLRIITGGYGGVMKAVAKVSSEIASRSGFNVENFGVLYSAYKEKPNQYLDQSLHCTSLAQRVQTLVEMADIIIALPGGSGTFQELIYTIEMLKNGFIDRTENFLLIHEYWRNKLIGIDNDIDKFCTYFENDLAIDKSVKNQRGEFTKGTNQSVHEYDDIINRINFEINSHNSNSIIGYDLAYNIEKAKVLNISKNISISTKEYLRSLNIFLKENGSIINVTSDYNYYAELDNRLMEEPTLQPIVETELDDTIIKGPSKNVLGEFQKWNSNLEKFNLGQSSFWICRVFDFEGYKVAISNFLVLNICLPELKRKRIINLMLQSIFETGLKIILKKINEIDLELKLADVFRDNVLYQQHSLGQIDIKSSLYSAEKALNNDNYERVREMIDIAYNTYDLQTVISDAIFGRINVESWGFKNTLSGIINFINTKTKDREVDIVINLTKNNNQLLDVADVRDYFTILFNLWTNAVKGYGGSNTKLEIIELYDVNGTRLIFKNDKVMDDVYVNFLNGTGHYPNTSSLNYNSPKYKGLHIVKDLCEKKGVLLSASSNAKQGTEIVLIVK